MRESTARPADRGREKNPPDRRAREGPLRGAEKAKRKSGGGGGNRTPVPRRIPSSDYARSPRFVVVPEGACGPAPPRTSRRCLAPVTSGGVTGASPRMTVRPLSWAKRADRAVRLVD